MYSPQYLCTLCAGHGVLSWAKLLVTCSNARIHHLKSYNWNTRPNFFYHLRLLAHDGTVHMMSYTTRSIGSRCVRGVGTEMVSWSWQFDVGIYDEGICCRVVFISEPANLFGSLILHELIKDFVPWTIVVDQGLFLYVFVRCGVRNLQKQLFSMIVSRNE